MSGIAEQLRAVHDRTAAAADRAGRDPRDITLIAVTKTHPVPAIREAWAAGQRDFGENRVQEAAPKIAELRDAGIDARWHLVGPLQRNKVRSAIDLFDILHSVDSERLAEAIDGRATRRIEVLLEVNVGEEPQKHGASPADVGRLAERIGRMPHLDLAGLMTVAPQVDDPEDVRTVFRRLRQMRDALGLRELSMGMTDDFEVAVEEGSTLVRVGRAIFGPRAVRG